MNKIGILTHHSVYNFGANLQALSTQECLRKKGYDAYIINWIPKDLHEVYINTTPKLQCEEHELFFKKYYRLTEECYTCKDVARVIEKEKFDGIVIGSDAVTRHFPFSYRYSIGRKGFRKVYLNSTDYYPNPYWGCFSQYLTKKIPVCMMSVSSQGTYWKDITGWEKNKIGKSLQKCSFISVRDSFTQEAFAYFTDNNVIPQITPDPVFSLNQNLDLSEEEKKERYVIFSFKKETMPPESWISQLKMQFNKNNYKVVSLPYPQEECCFEVDEKIQLPLSPLDWYNIIKDSSGYIGNNMHPIVAALHNSIPVFSFDYYAVRRNKKSEPEITKSKIYDLLKNANLLDNYYNIQFGYNNIPDYNYVFDKIVSPDKELLKNFSSSMKQQYDLMIQSMINYMENKK